MSLLPLLLTSVLSAFAADKPVCNAKAVTRDCKFFEDKKDSALITFPDGSYMGNPRYVSRANGTDNGAYGSLGAGVYGTNDGGANGYGGGATGVIPGGAGQYNYEDSIASQAEIIDQLSGSRFSTRFKMTMAPLVGAMAANPDVPVTLPWPPDSTKPEPKAITGKELFKYIQGKLKPSAYKSFMKLVDKQKEPLIKAQLDAQKSMQESLAKRQEQAEIFEKQANLQVKKKEKIRDLFKYTKENMIAMIRNGRKDEQLSAEQKAAIAKIETIALRDLNDSTTAQEPTCSTSMQENAFYQPMHHELAFCPGYLYHTDADIVSVMAHEMGHAIDSCNGQFPLYSIDHEALSKFVNQEGVSDVEKQTVRNNFKPSAQFANVDIAVALDKNFFEKLKKAGVVQEKASGSSYSNYVFKEEAKCMVKKNGFRENTFDDISYTKRVLNSSLKYVDNESRPFVERTAKRYAEGMQKYPQCFGTLRGPSRMAETMSDVIGSVILEKYFMDYPPKNEEEKVASVSTWISGTCKANSTTTDFTKTLDSLSPFTMARLIEDKSARDSHASNSQRLEQVYLNLPGTAALFNCQRKAEACFDNLSFYNRTPSSQRPSFGSETQKGAQ